MGHGLVEKSLVHHLLLVTAPAMWIRTATNTFRTKEMTHQMIAGSRTLATTGPAVPTLRRPRKSPKIN